MSMALKCMDVSSKVSPGAVEETLLGRTWYWCLGNVGSFYSSVFSELMSTLHAI